MIWAMFSVALGWMVASRTPRPWASLKYSSMYFSEMAWDVVPSSLARLMILSSTSVKFCTKVTWYPRYSRYRRSTSKRIMGRALPTWM